MLTIDEQIAQIQEVLRKTPHHKATNGFIGSMRAKISRLKDRQIEASGKSGGGGGGYQVKKQGDATVVLVGPPSAGKSTLLNRLTNAESKVAPYAFTTVTVVPGMLKHNDAYIQILDIPGLIEGASKGKGRGKEVLSVARSADLIVIMTDIERIDLIPKMTAELEGVGIRLNKKRPEIHVDKKTDGGLNIKSNIRQDLDKDVIKDIAHEYGINNADITLKQNVTFEDLFDAFSSNRVYVPAIYIVNKIDQKHSVKNNQDYIQISAENGQGVDNLVSKIWEALKFVSVDLQNGHIIMKEGDTIADVADKIGSNFSDTHKLVKIWGEGARFPGQEVSLSTKVKEGMKIIFQ